MQQGKQNILPLVFLYGKGTNMQSAYYCSTVRPVHQIPCETPGRRMHIHRSAKGFCSDERYGLLKCYRETWLGVPRSRGPSCWGTKMKIEVSPALSQVICGSKSKQQLKKFVANSPHFLTANPSRAEQSTEAWIQLTAQKPTYAWIDIRRLINIDHA